MLFQMQTDKWDVETYPTEPTAVLARVLWRVNPFPRFQLHPDSKVVAV